VTVSVLIGQTQLVLTSGYIISHVVKHGVKVSNSVGSVHAGIKRLTVIRQSNWQIDLWWYVLYSCSFIRN